MKIVVLILSLVTFASPGGCHPAAPTASDRLTVNSDGTATVTGIVLENNYGCAHDSACYLRVRAEDREVRVIYNPGESSDRVNNDEATEIAGKVKKDAHVEVYGKHSKQGALDVIEIYSSKDSYIHVLSD